MMAGVSGMTSLADVSGFEILGGSTVPQKAFGRSMCTTMGNCIDLSKDMGERAPSAPSKNNGMQR